MRCVECDVEERRIVDEYDFKEMCLECGVSVCVCL